MKRIFLAMFLLSALQGCMFYYKVQTVNPVTFDAIKQYDSLKKYLILHQRDNALHISVLNITDSSLFGYLSVLPSTSLQYKTTKPHGGNRYRKDYEYSESYVLKQVHFYLQDSLVPIFKTYDRIKILYSAIKKAEVYNEAKVLTTASWVIPIIVSTVPAILLLRAIVISNMSFNLDGW